MTPEHLVAQGLVALSVIAAGLGTFEGLASLLRRDHGRLWRLGHALIPWGITVVVGLIAYLVSQEGTGPLTWPLWTYIGGLIAYDVGLVLLVIHQRRIGRKA